LAFSHRLLSNQQSNTDTGKGRATLDPLSIKYLFLVKNEMKPTEKTDSHESTRIDHPAFGMITLTTTSGGDGRLFGSDLKHPQKLLIQVHRAHQLRHLSRDWNHSDELLVELEMSQAQFTEFITSRGSSGTPVTLRIAPTKNSPLERVAPIDAPPSKLNLHKSEVREETVTAIKDIKEAVEKLGQLIETGKLGKKDLSEIHRNLNIQLGNLPSNLAYAVESAQTAMHQAAESAKMDVESYITHLAIQLGMKQLQKIDAPSLIEDEDEEQAPIAFPRQRG
jgi:hypothetical protein